MRRLLDRPRATLALVFLPVLAVWLVSGVSAREALVFGAYELAYALLPGVLLHRALRGPRTWLEELSVGWALGYALQAAALVVTGSTGTRGVYPFFPLLLLPLYALARRRRGTFEPAAGFLALAAVVVASLAVTYVAALQYPEAPLPRHAAAVDYDNDIAYLLSLSAEAKHHWPVEAPFAAGESLPYHVFSLLRIGAASDVTGIDLTTVFLRLEIVPLVVLLALQTMWLATCFAGARVAPLAAALVLLSGEIDITPKDDSLVNGSFTSFLWHPAHAFALVFVTPLLWLLFERMQAPLRAQRLRDWLVALALLFGLGGAKGGSVLPVLIGGAAVYALWLLLARRLVSMTAVAICIGLSAYLGLLTEIQYRRGSTGMTWDPWAGLPRLGIARALHLRVSGTQLKDHLLALTLTLAVFMLLGAVLVGIALLVWSLRGRIEPWHAYAIGLLLVTLPLLYLFDHPGQSNLHAVWYALPAAAVVAADGYVRFFAAWMDDRRTLLAFAAAWVGCLLAVGGLASHFLAFESIAVDLVAIGIAFVAAGLLGLVRRRGRRLGLAPLVLAVLLTPFLDLPLDGFPKIARAVITGEPAYRAGDDLTPPLYQGLAWVRDHTRGDAVLAVNNQYSSPGDDGEAPPEPMYSLYSGLTERRMFLEGWGSGPQALEIGLFAVVYGFEEPFPQRTRLNERVFLHADRAALATLVGEYGVRYLLVDKVHTATLVLPSEKVVRRQVDPRVAQLGHRVFSNSALDVIAVG